MIKSVVEAIFKNSELYPKKLCIVIEENEITYDKFKHMIINTAKKLKKLGVNKNEKVLIVGVPKLSYIVTYFAIHLCGAIAVPYEKNAESEYITMIENKIKPVLIFIDSNIIKENEKYVNIEKFFIDDSINYIEEYEFTFPYGESIADLLFTTGTTGLPKAVVMTHTNILAGAQNVASGGELTVNDVEMVTAPLNHSYALGTIRGILYIGGTLIIQDGVTLIKEMIYKINKYSCTGIALVPAAIRILIQQTRGKLNLLFGKLRFIASGSAPISADLKKKLIDMLPGLNIYVSYGLTESPRTVYMDITKNQDKLESIGKPVINSSFKIVDEQGNEILDSSSKKTGRIAAFGIMNMPGYLDDDEKTREVLHEGWFYSQDIGYIDNEGYIYLTGRISDFINIGGEKISPLDIEDFIMKYEGIENCACIGVPDPNNILGEVPVAYIVTNNNIEINKEKLRKFLSEHLKSKLLPIDFISIKKMPTNYVGKVDRKKLKEIFKN